MNSKTFFDNFETIANAPGGIARLRELILDLAIRGALVGQDDLDTPLDIAWDFDLLKLDSQKIWGNELLESTPKSWARLPLALIGKWGSGGTPKRGNRTYYGGEIPWLVIGDLNDGLVLNAENFITKKGLAESSATLVPKGAVFVAMYGSIGKSGIAGIECATNQAIAHCVPDQNLVSTEFLFRLILGLRKRLFGQGRGLAQQNISQTVLKHLMVSLPPLTEQRRIVAKVDQLMALCDELESAQIQRNSIRTSARRSAIDSISTATTPDELNAAWKRISNNWLAIADSLESISSLRSLILGLAVRGKLSDQNSDERAMDLPELDGLFEIPNNWVWSTLEEIADYGGRGNVSPNEIIESDWVLDLEDIEKTTSRLLDRVRSKDRKTTSTKARFETGDVLYGKLRPYLDKVLVADAPGYCTTEIIPISPKFDIDPQWLRISLKSPVFIGYVTEKSYGMKMPRLGTKDAKASLHAVPPPGEQKRIVAKVDELMALCDQLENSLMLRNELTKKITGSLASEIAA